MNTTNYKILIVDDERDVREPLAKYLHGEGYSVSTACDGLDALKKLSFESVDIILTDIQMPNMNGLDLLRKVKSLYPAIKVIIFTAYGAVESAVTAIKGGAQDYILKPVIFEDIKQKIDRLIIKKENQKITGQTSRDKSSQQALDAIIGDSSSVKKLKELIVQVAFAGSYALIQGESGTGKELVSRALHFTSMRWNKPFIIINCAAIPEHLLESEFFGHAKGAFTGAITDKKGFFEIADKGTLFLDEIGELPMTMQAKLLRAIESNEIIPLGKTKPIPIDITIIAASAKILTEEIAAKRFREDLFFRINVIEINIPPLREHPEDIKLLADFFLSQVIKNIKTTAKSFSDLTYSALERYQWPGNIRELRNVVERAIVLCRGDKIMPNYLPDYIKQCIDDREQDDGYKTAMRNFEKELIEKTLNSCNNDKKLAAKLLGIALSSLYRKLEELKIES